MALRLSDEQQAIVDFVEYTDDPLMVSARAGTGKTTVCLAAVSKLRGTTWFCAFGKRIALEIESRAEDWPDIDSDRVRFGTVHAGGRRILTRHWPRVSFKVDRLKVYNIVQDKAQRSKIFRYNAWRIGKMVELAKQCGFGVLYRLSSYEAWYSLIDHFGLDIGVKEGKEHDWDALIDAAVEVYQESLRQCTTGLIDFSDMLLAPLYYEAKMPRYDNLVIDEAQDISPLRLRLLLDCLSPDGRVISVGDPYQAIFGFTGSDDRSMDTIRERTGANLLPLTVSRRCTKAAIARAQSLVPDIVAHEDALSGLDITTDLNDDPTGAHQALTIWDVHRTKPFNCDDVVLCRNNRPLASLAFTMIRKRIPCYVEGREEGLGLVSLIKRLDAASWAKGNLNSLAAKVQDWREEEVFKFEQRKQNYKAEYVNDQAETILHLIALVQEDGYGSTHSLIQVIDGMYKDTGEDGKPKCITLSSIHKAKGKEWDRVFLLGRTKYMPSRFARQDWEQQQERNLEYVAYTRNKKEFIEVNDNGKS